MSHPALIAPVDSVHGSGYYAALTEDQIAAIDAALDGYEPDLCDHDTGHDDHHDTSGDHIGWCPSERSDLLAAWDAVRRAAGWVCPKGHPTTPPLVDADDVEYRLCPTCYLLSTRSTGVIVTSP